MTLNEFLHELKQCKYKFNVVPELGFIRTFEDNYNRYYCPIEAVAGRFGVHGASTILGLSESVTDRIIEAADVSRTRKERSLRKRLLKATGLS